MKYTGKQGILRIYDSAIVIHGAAPLDNETIQVRKYDGGAWTTITTDVEADDANIATAFIADNNDVIYIGSTSRFSMIKYLKGGGTNFAAGSGALIDTYYNGSSWVALSGMVDGTASGGDCFAQDGYISFKIPQDWAKRGETQLATDKYYIKLMATTSPGTDPDADVLAPVDGQYFEIAFAAMDFSGPTGRSKTDEVLVLNRAKMDSKGHYIEGVDDKIYEPQEISFSCLIDDSHNKDIILTALACGDPDGPRWTATGTTSKGDTKNDGTNANPGFRETAKKAVNIQILFDETNQVPQGWAYYETFFPMDEQSLAEAEDGITLSCRGGVYGMIERIHGFGNRY